MLRIPTCKGIAIKMEVEEENKYIIVEDHKPLFSYYQNLNKKIYWTRQAIECYQRNCKCEGCFINKVCESKCMMRFTLKELVKRFGVPPSVNEKKRSFIDGIYDNWKDAKLE